MDDATGEFGYLMAILKEEEELKQKAASGDVAAQFLLPVVSKIVQERSRAFRLSCRYFGMLVPATGLLHYAQDVGDYTAYLVAGPFSLS